MDTFVAFENNIARAFKTDLDKLILTYEKEQTLLFEPFTQIWRDMTFSLIYGGQIVAAELKIFTELLYRITVKYVVADRSLFAKTGALYTLYGLYYKQPINCWIKIRLTYEHAKSLNQLIGDLKQNGAQEALFVYGKMCTDSAFDYVATELPRGLEIKFGRQQYVGLVDPYVIDETSISSSSLDTIDLTQLETVDELYKNELKKFKANPKVMLITQETGQSIGQKLQSLMEELRNPNAQQKKTVDDIQVKRAKLKQKAHKADVKSYGDKLKDISKILDQVRVKFEEMNEDSD